MNSRRTLQLPLRAPTTRVPISSRFSVRNVSTTAHQNTAGQPSRWTRRLIYAGIFGTLGVGAGKWLYDKISAPPAPGSTEDQAELQKIQRAFDIGLPIVRELRKNPDYVETSVYEDFAEEHKTRRLTSGPLAGSRGLGLQVSCLCVRGLGCMRGGH